MEVGIPVPPLTDGMSFTAQMRAAEDAGVQAVWTYDSGRGAEPFATMGLCASVTHNIRLCCGILNPFIRHPAILASGVATIDRLSEGRSTLVMGIGWAPKIERVLRVPRTRPFSDFRDSIRIIKRLLNGEEVTHRAGNFSLANVRLEIMPYRPEVPVYVAGGGGRGLKIALQVADGFLTDFGRAALQYVAWMREQRLAYRPAERPAFKLGLYCGLCVTERPAEVMERAKRSVVWSLVTTPRNDPYYDIVGVDRSLIDEVRRVTGIDDVIGQNRDPRQALDQLQLAEAAAKIPERLADALIAHCAVIGSADKCAHMLREFEHWGVDFVLLDSYSPFDESLKAIEDILRRL